MFLFFANKTRPDSEKKQEHSLNKNKEFKTQLHNICGIFKDSKQFIKFAWVKIMEEIAKSAQNSYEKKAEVVDDALQNGCEIYLFRIFG